MSPKRKPRPPATADELRAMIRRRLEHRTWQEIADRHGYSHPQAAHRAAVQFAKAAGDELLLHAIRGYRARPPRGFYNRYGYMERYLPDHPLATRSGKVLEHRVVLFDAIGPGPHPCSRCGQMLYWPHISIDHINHDRVDNRLENLRVFCRSCNGSDGARWRWGCGYPAWMFDENCPDNFCGPGEYVPRAGAEAAV